MITHYFKIATRNILRQKLYSSINILGLSVSLSAAFIILLFIIHELSFDKHHKNKNQIYRVINNIQIADETISRPSAPFTLANVLKENLPEIIDQSRIGPFFEYAFSKYYVIDREGKEVRETNFQLVDNSLFNIFSIPFIYKNNKELLLDENSLVISEKIAQKYFGDNNPVGQTLVVKTKKGEKSFVINGVFENMPKTSSLQADFLGSLALMEYDDYNIETYLLLTDEVNITELEKKILKIAAQGHELSNNKTFSLQSLNDVYFHSSHFNYYGSSQGNMSNIIIYALIAIAIVFIATINFIIISTAQANARAMEIGVRKTFGASRSQIVIQILTESILIFLIALPTAIVLSEIFLPIANQIFTRDLKINSRNNWKYAAGVIFLTFCIAISAGSYVSLYLSRFEPIKVLKNQIISGTPNIFVRKILIIIQLTIFVCLIICTSLINQQVNFAQNKDLGFDRKNLITVNINSNVEMYLNEIQSNPNIISSACASMGLLTRMSATDAYHTQFKPDDPHSFKVYDVGSGYIETIGMKIIMGRDFYKPVDSDSSSVIINETGVKILGLENPIGQIIKQTDGEKSLKIIGVIKDFNITSVRKKIPPVIIVSQESAWQVVLRLKDDHMTETISFLEKKWNEIFSPVIFRYYSVDSVFRNQYQLELDFAFTIRTFTILAILIAALGLFGLSTLLAKQRIKDIGIRKTFGASTYNIIKMMTKEFMLIVLIANFIAWPGSYYFIDRWLNNFAYSISISLMTFVLAGVCSAIFVLTIVGIIVYKASIANPIDSLKYE